MKNNITIKKLVNQTAIYGVSSTLAKFLNYLLTPFLTRVLTQDVYGEVSYFYAIIPFINVLLTLGFSTGYFRFASRCDSRSQQKSLFSTLWGAVSFFSLIFCGTFAILYPRPEVLTMLALILVDNIAAMPLSLLRHRGRAGLYVISNTLGVVVNVTVCYYFYMHIEGTTQSPMWVLLANLIASVVGLTIIMPTALKWLSFKIDWSLFKKVAKYSIPLMVAGIMGVGSGLIDRFMLRWVLPEDIALAELGVYSAVARIAALMVLFRQIYTLGAEPFFLQKFKEGDFARLSSAALKYFTAVGLIIVLGLILFSDIFSHIVGEEFRGEMDILPILLVANLLAGILVNLSFWYKVVDKTSVAVLVTLSGVVVSVGLNFILIPLFQNAGAAWSRLISTVVMVTMCYALGQKYCYVKYDYKSLGLYSGMGALIYIASIFTKYIEIEYIRWTINLAMITIFCIIFVRRENLFGIIKKLLKL